MLKIRDAILSKKEVPKNDLPTYTLELPSRGVFYEKHQSSIKVTPLLVSQARQLKAASETKNISLREQEIANIIGRSITDFNVFDLTMGDYEFVARWLKLNSYQKSPYRINWEYPITDSEGNPILDAEGKAENKSVVTTVKNSDLQVKECERLAVPTLGYERVRDRIEILALESESDKEIAKYAVVISGDTIAQKIQNLDKYEVEFLHEIKQHQVKFHHGIDEYINLKDPEVIDAPSFRYKLEFNIADFFP